MLGDKTRDKPADGGGVGVPRFDDAGGVRGLECPPKDLTVSAQFLFEPQLYSQRIQFQHVRMGVRSANHCTRFTRVLTVGLRTTLPEWRGRSPGGLVSMNLRDSELFVAHSWRSEVFPSQPLLSEVRFK